MFFCFGGFKTEKHKILKRELAHFLLKQLDNEEKNITANSKQDLYGKY